MTLAQWTRAAGNPYTEMRGDRVAVCVQFAGLYVVAAIYDLHDYVVVAVCGPFVELLPRFPEKDGVDTQGHENPGSA